LLDLSQQNLPNKASLEKIKKENAHFKDELDGKQNIQSAGNIGSQIAVLQKFGDNYAKRIEKEKKKLEDLNGKIKDVQFKIE